MNNRTLRMKNSKKAVTPVIATIILIAATIVLALVVGAYTFGLFGSNVKTVTLVSATLYGGATGINTGNKDAGTSSLSVSLNNPGSATTLTSLTLTGTALSSPISAWNYTVTGTSGYFIFATTAPPMAPGQVSTYTFYGLGTTAVPILTGQTFNYVINYQNGQSVSGSLIAQ